MLRFFLRTLPVASTPITNPRTNVRISSSACDISSGQTRTLALAPRSVAEFYGEFLGLLNGLGIEVKIWPVPVEIPSTMEDNFNVDPAKIEAAVTPRTKAILLGFPNNPTGAVATRDRDFEVRAAAA